jgi:hypothetical protein
MSENFKFSGGEGGFLLNATIDSGGQGFVWVPPLNLLVDRDAAS